MNAVAIPTNATIHIQKTAPGPPMATASATPARFPVPTREAIVILKAWNALIPRRPLCSTASSVMTLNILPNKRNWTNLLPNVK